VSLRHYRPPEKVDLTLLLDYTPNKMPKRAKKVQTDGELLRQLEDATGKEESVEAVMRLRSEKASEIVPSPKRTEQLTKKVLRRAQAHTGGNVSDYNVFGNLGYFFVSADAAVVRDLIEQPEIASATANKQPGHSLVKPVKKRIVSRQPAKQLATKSSRLKTHSKAGTTSKKAK
jgi:hypothetical protein